MKKLITRRFSIKTDGLMRTILSSILLLPIPSNIVIIREPSENARLKELKSL